jgi:HD-GYP domain-containing protein (c-di-GMP phosphodiesterase class II)
LPALKSSAYLDLFLHPQHPPIHRAILSRLIPLWLLLSLLVGAVTYWIESSQVNNYVLSQSREATERFVRASKSTPTDLDAIELQVRLDKLLKQTELSGIRVYDTGQKLQIESWKQSGLAAVIKQFPFPEKTDIHAGWRQQTNYNIEPLKNIIPLPASQPYTQRQGDHFYVQSLQPIISAQGQRIGYMEGIYQLPQQAAQAIRSTIRDSLIGVLLVIALSTATLYPVIVALNRDSTRLTHDLLNSNIELMRVLGSAIAKRDSDTDSHNYRVTLYAVRLAQELKRPQREIIGLMTGAFLHDVGKIGISDAILLKPGKLSSEEFAIMKTHVNIGLDILKEVQWLDIARDVVSCHHERFDGTGYPNGKAGQDIPFNARLFAIVDVFDALTSSRPYKDALPYTQAMDIMRQESGSHFDPQLFSFFETRAASLHASYSAADHQTLRAQMAILAIGKYFRQTRNAG